MLIQCFLYPYKIIFTHSPPRYELVRHQHFGFTAGDKTSHDTPAWRILGTALWLVGGNCCLPLVWCVSDMATLQTSHVWKNGSVGQFSWR